MYIHKSETINGKERRQSLPLNDAILQGQLRYEALSRSWNQQRDRLRGRDRVDRIAWRLVPIVAALLALAVLAGCAAPFLPKEPRIGARGAPDLYLEDGTPCWYIAAARHPLICNRRAP